MQRFHQRVHVCLPTNVQGVNHISTWRKSGCWPIDLSVFTDEDFAPSVATFTTVSCVPTLYPSLPNPDSDTSYSEYNESSSSDSRSSDGDSDDESTSDQQLPQQLHTSNVKKTPSHITHLHHLSPLLTTPPLLQNQSLLTYSTYQHPQLSGPS